MGRVTQGLRVGDVHEKHPVMLNITLWKDTLSRDIITLFLKRILRQKEL